jgi:cytochrome c oxidase subunit III
MNTVAMEQRKKIHPHKFTLWVAIGSIIMMFAGLTSAYVVKRNQAGWVSFELPSVFWFSTAVIMVSSVTMWMALRAFKERNLNKYRLLLSCTSVLGILFVILQVMGFYAFEARGMKMIGVGSLPSYSFILAIAGLHAVHVLGGVIAMIIMTLNAFSVKVRNYSVVPVELISTYWQFVDVLWIYLLIFLMMIR